MLKLNDFHRARMQEEEKKKTRRFTATGSPVALEDDLLAGLQKSVQDGRIRVALEYLYSIALAQQAQIDELQEFVNDGKADAPGKKIPSEPDMPAGPIPKPNPTKFILF